MGGLTEAKGASLALDDELASKANAKGASLVGVEDVAGNFTGADVEAVLAELFTSGNFLNAIVDKSAPYTTVVGDRGKIINVTNATTITLLAAATAGSGHALVIRTNGVATVTVDGNAAETINSSATLTLSPGHWAILTCDGANWTALEYTPASSASTSGLANYNKDAFLQYGGDESDGAFSSIGASTLSNPVYNHTTFALNAGHTITADVPVVIIRATTSIVIDGNIDGKGADISGGAGVLLARLGESLGASGGGGGGGDTGAGLHVPKSPAEAGADGEDTYFQKGGAGGTGQTEGGGGTAGSIGVAVATNQKTLLTALFSNLIARGGGAGGKGGDGGVGDDSGGSYSGGGAGGAGGLAGGLIILIAPIITLSAVTTIDLTGEAGSAGGTATYGGDAGGGGGGAGGCLMLVSPSITDSGATLTVAAGAGGAAGGTASAGAAGAAGYTYNIDPTA